MAKRKTSIPFHGTAEQEAKLQEVINKYKGVQGSLMPVLQQAQDIYGYLPIEVQKKIAEGLDVPLAKIYGVATFYAQFTLNPKGKYAIAVCLGTACFVNGAADVLERIKEKLGIETGDVTPDGKFSLEETRCLGCCALAPVMTVNGEVYGRLVPDDVDTILDSFKDDND